MGSNLPKRNRADRAAAERMLIDGLLNHAAEFPTAVIDGAARTTADMVALLQARLDSAHAVESARASWLAAVQEDHAEHARTRTYVAGLRQVLVAAFGRQVDTLADFGLTPRALHVRTPEEKLVVIARSRATRAARHTMGSRQKAKITGTVAPAAEEPSVATRPEDEAAVQHASPA